MSGLWLKLVQIFLWSLGLVFMYCTLLIIGIRLGWFLWLGNKLLALRHKKHSKESLKQDTTEEN